MALDISEATGIVTKDIIQTLLDMGMFKYLKSKYYIVNDRVSYDFTINNRDSCYLYNLS